MSILSKIFGDAHEKYLKKVQPLVEKINLLEKDLEKLSDDQLKGKTVEFKERARKDESLAQILPDAFALVREAAKRNLNQRHFDCQLSAGIALHEGKIAEMKTGEGKTITATLPLYLNALEGKGCHLVTVNDYLAKRDMVWMGQIYHALGLSVGCIAHEAAYLYDPEYQQENPKSEIRNPKQIQNPKSKIQNGERDKLRDTVGGFKVVESYLRPCSRKEAYSADITYGTNNEFGFDYLRDNMDYDLSQQVQRGFNYVIVDEVDSILIDEARTPLIISAPDTESSKWYLEFARLIPKLNHADDYQIDEKLRAVTLTENGINKIEKILGMGNIYEEKGLRYLHHLEQALRAQSLFKKDKDYVVQAGEVIIVDEFTGRLMPGRRWSGGLHQAIEAKEGVGVRPESLTLASITFQNYFRLYKKLAGMTGTADTSAEEFDKVYGLEVIIVPTNKPMLRKDLPDQIYKTEDGKFKALVKEIKKRQGLGQSLLVGTTSIEKNEYLGRLLEREGVGHQILNAKHHEREGEIIAQAGRLGAVTIATNMAGRGVDIMLGGVPPSKFKVQSSKFKVEEINPEYKKWEEEHNKAVALGGLHVIGTERHEARRIDNQLRGRSGRQGDPGSSQFFISLEDNLMRIFGGEKIKQVMSLLKIPDDQPIEAGLISKAIGDAQSKIEGMNFDLRKHLLDYDDVMNMHRETFYRKRREMLEIENCKLKIENWLKTPEEKKALEEKVKELGENFNSVAKFVSLRILDNLWLEHLENMEHLQDSVRLRAYGQRDPLVEYKMEGHRMFKNLIANQEATIAKTILTVRPTAAPIQAKSPAQPVQLAKEKPGLPAEVRGAPSFAKASAGKKVGRNDPCPCGAKHPDGRPVKYKHCHGKNV
ncbi:preprotein translocase subunit SecA [Patescibacteria group bacterium]|nr:preprotein translocase subunit SecA [Patescibacteria group bacterium]